MAGVSGDGRNQNTFDVEAGLGTQGQQHEAAGHPQQLHADPNLAWVYWHRQHSNLIFGTYRAVMCLILLLLFMGTLPASMMVWAALCCIFAATCIRLYWWQHLTRVVAGLDLESMAGLRQNGADGTWGGLLMTLGSSGTPLDILNLRLSLIDRDFNEEDYEILLALDQTMSLATPRNAVTDSHLASLPVHMHPGCTTSSKTIGTGRRQVDRAGLLRSWGSSKDTPDEELLCSVCLDDVVEGEKVMTLPCHHQFHSDCIKPWLKQSGLSASCPICKLRVFA